jgi:hypothetical protein
MTFSIISVWLVKHLLHSGNTKFINAKNSKMAQYINCLLAIEKTGHKAEALIHTITRLRGI